MSLVTQITAAITAIGQAVKADRIRLTALEAIPPSVTPATVAPLMDGTAAVGAVSKYAKEDHVHPTDTSRAPLASPTLTGVPAAPTAAANASTTQLATTEFATTADNLRVKIDGTTPFTAVQSGVAGTLPAHLTTKGQFTWPQHRATFSQSVPTRRVWTAVSALTAVSSTLGSWATVAGGTITIAQAGVVVIGGFATHPTTNAVLGMRALHNGTVVAANTGNGWNSVNAYAGIGAVILCAIGDTITFQLNHDTLAGATLTGQVSATRTNGVV